jgi:thymidylate synthase ThyX
MKKPIDFDALIKDQPKRQSKSGAILTWAGNLPAEALGMILSMASREAGGYAKNILKLLGETDIGKWFQKFFVGYGHKSIADCGWTAIAIDKASMLAAVSFEHHPLFNGQETSTRYVDVTGLDYIVPQEKAVLHNMMQECFAMYTECLEPLVDHMRLKYPYQEGWDPKVYETTVRTKALDVLGSLLPAGARTNFSVVMNLRQMRDHLSLLRHHPLAEIRDLSETSVALLQDEHPGAFAKVGEDMEREDYRKLSMEIGYYEQIPWKQHGIGSNETIGFQRRINGNKTLRDLLETRSKGTELPWRFNRNVVFKGSYEIDFRSFRDLHRQRSMNQSMPLLSTELGFEKWYLEQMPDGMAEHVREWLDDYSMKLQSIDLSPADKQYLTPMGYKVAVEFSVGLAHLVYIIELRTQQTVHPTVRRVVKSWAETLQHFLPEVKLYANMDPDKFDIKRGSQTIMEKKA